MSTDGTSRPSAEGFAPSNLLEDALVRARAGQLAPADFLRVLLMSDLAVPSTAPVDAAGRGLQPVTYEKAGSPMVAAYSSLERAKAAAGLARYALTIRGRALLRGLPPEFGLVLNPGLAAGMDITPDGIADALRNLAAPATG